MKFIVWSSIAGFKVILYSLAYWVVVLIIEFVVKLIRRRKK
jgi:hypothetical protein